MSEKQNRLIEWAREIQALAQTGLTYAQNHYEVDRNRRLSEIAAEILSATTTIKFESAVESFLGQKGYSTPKVDVRAAVVKDGKILLVKEISDGRWSMPGGWADVGDMPAKAAEREAKEESGFDVKAVKVIGVFDANRNGRPMVFYHAVKLVYLCEIIGGKAEVSDETSEVEFFDFDNLPELSRNRTNTKHIDEIREHLSNPLRATYFE
jgi:ADP-ribose pyrophosphatase YjhB (NUDIX family)